MFVLDYPHLPEIQRRLSPVQLTGGPPQDLPRGVPPPNSLSQATPHPATPLPTTDEGTPSLVPRLPTIFDCVKKVEKSRKPGNEAKMKEHLASFPGFPCFAVLQSVCECEKTCNTKSGGSLGTPTYCIAKEISIKVCVYLTCSF